MNIRFIFITCFIVSGLMGFFSYYLIHKMHYFQSDITTIQTFHYPSHFVDQLRHDPQAGEKIYKEFCSTCHANPPMIDINAPRLGDKKMWKALGTAGKQTLLMHTVNGMGAMPARGGCFECSDSQLNAAIDYILSH